LSQAPGSDAFRISVKREANHDPRGKVSNFLCDQLHKGDTLGVSAPAGDFYLEKESKPVAFIAGGVGVTPMMAVLESNRRLIFLQCSTAPFFHPFCHNR
jgi:nitric oxide dioxygenase